MARRPNLIFDVGLHKGEDTDFYLQKGFNVVAFEADPDLAAFCRTRFKQSICDGRLRIVEGAIAPESAGGWVTFYRNPQKSDWGTIDPEWVERNERLGTRPVKLQIERVDFANALREHGIPFYLKIDIEGADKFVLQELQKFGDRPIYLSMEAEKCDFSELLAELECLRSLGYTRFKAVQQATIPGSRLATATLDGQDLLHVFPDYASGPFGDDLSGRWLGYDECLRRFELIFRLYSLFGDQGYVPNLPAGRQLMRLLMRLRRGPLPGWHDIHAKLE